MMPSILIARNQASGQNLVDSTKIARIVNDSKTSLPKEKKDKERRKQKKEKREKSHKHSSKKSTKSPGVSEKSGVTEELDGPQNHLGYLSDGSQNSNKRKRDCSPPAVESVVKVVPVAGKPLRIRLTFKKPKLESPPLPREDVVACSTSGAESLNQAPQAAVCSSVCEPELNVPSTSETKKICEPEVNVPSASEAAVAGEANKRKKHKPTKEDRYNALFDDWTPISTIAMEVDCSSKNDDDWLFGSRTKERTSCKAANKIDEDVRASCDSSWPKAQFLSQVGIYSLPYTVPF
ncbi:hypothetical protein BRARA_G03388 [Brassica rapa]|uniref:Uncharacterized protein n=1 Tax=Brassica campestris TaxID=3711 RepID=A0A397YRY8_BRACM|nr:hypothetical protein BRARA_G03388 [Brassica rapa]